MKAVSETIEKFEAMRPGMEVWLHKEKANQEKMKAVFEKMKATLVAGQKETKARMDVFEGKLEKIDVAVKVGQEKMEARVETGEEQTKAESRTELEEMTATVSETVAKQQEVPNEETTVEIFAVFEDRSGDHQPAIRYRNLLKKRTQDNVIRETHKGPTSKRRRLTGPESSNGIKNRGMEEQVCLGSKRTLGETFWQTVELEIAERTVGPSIGLRKVSDRTL
jgi:hypothetical protein